MKYAKAAVLLMIAVVNLGMSASAASAQSSTSDATAATPVQSTWVMKPTLTGKTPSLYEIKDKFVPKPFKEAEPVKRPSWLDALANTPEPASALAPDQALQNIPGPNVALTSGLTFDGVGEGFTGPNGTYSVNSVPPDSDMAVGTTQVVSLVNTAFAVLDKTTGAVMAGPFDTNVLWSALGTSAACEQDDDGDAIVKFDQLAQRWIITQFAVEQGGTTGPFYQCVAISQSADATGSYTVFQFNPNTAHNYFPDYPKISVWPDVYSMTFDLFNGAGTTYEGGAICGIDRVALLAGNNPTIVCAALATSDYALLPVDMDGATYPASGAKALYLEQNSTNNTGTQLYMYRAKYNFTAGTVAVDGRITITVTSYASNTCSNTSQCVPQPPHTGSVPSDEVFASESTLDTLAFHQMYRAAYRNFGSYESITLNGPVRRAGTGTNTAIRWYELRTPFSTPTVYQQSTYSPDTTLYRWMGSIAQDHRGNMLLGYSGSSSTTFPSLYITGRLNNDTINTMEAETQVFAGLNSQVNVTINGTSYAYGYRWGDYSAMMVDPDDCTFWFANEYLAQAGEFNWSNRIGSSSFPSCSSTAAITQPIPGSTLAGSNATFYWLSGTGSPTYHLDIGKTQGGTDYYSQDQSTNVQAAVTTLPTDGSTVYVRLTQTVNGTPTYTDYTYLTNNSGPAYLTSPAPSSSLTSSSATFQWMASTTATAYWIDVGPSAGSNQFYSSGSLPTSTLSVSVTGLPTDGSTIYVTLYSLISGQWVSNAYTYTAYSNASSKAVMTSPVQGSILSGSSVTFNWSAGSGATAYWLDLGPGAGGNQYYSSGSLSSATLSESVSGLPVDGSTVYATLYSLVSGQWLSNAYTYVAGSVSKAAITSPAPNSVLSGSSVTFNWSAGSNATAYWLDLGPGAGGNQYYSSGSLSSATLSASVNGLPTDGSTIYATLYSMVNGQWLSNAYTYTAGSVTKAAITSPASNSVLIGSSVTFIWSAGSGATGYWLDIGTGPGGNQIYSSGNLGTAQSVSVSGLPTNGSALYVTLYSLLNGSWQSNGYTYTAANAVPASIISPTNGSAISGGAATFTWNAAAGATNYWLDIGYAPGGNQIFSSGGLGNIQQVTVTGLPTDGSSIYATLYSYIGGQWQYTSAGYVTTP